MQELEGKSLSQGRIAHNPPIECDVYCGHLHGIPNTTLTTPLTVSLVPRSTGSVRHKREQCRQQHQDERCSGEHTMRRPGRTPDNGRASLISVRTFGGGLMDPKLDLYGHRRAQNISGQLCRLTQSSDIQEGRRGVDV